MKYVFAGDRDIAVWVLKFLINQGYPPSGLMVSSSDRASHSDELKENCSLPEGFIWEGTSFKTEESVSKLIDINPDYIIGIHFPYLIPKRVLEIPRIGFINLHPAYLPFNRGWHTPSWAIMEETSIGATLHFMSEKLDEGDIIARRELEVKPYYTANTLYRELKQIEFQLFKDSLHQLTSLSPNRTPQDLNAGTSHIKKDLFEFEDRNLYGTLSDHWNKISPVLRAFSTNNASEAAYFVEGGEKYFVQLKITPEEDAN